MHCIIRVTLGPLYRFGPLAPGIAGAADGQLRHWLRGVMVLLVLWQRRGRIKEVRPTQSNCRVSRVKHESATLKNYRLYLQNEMTMAYAI